MSRFSGYKSGASTTGQRSWGKSAKTKRMQLEALKTNNVEAENAEHCKNLCSTQGPGVNAQQHIMDFSPSAISFKIPSILILQVHF